MQIEIGEERNTYEEYQSSYYADMEINLEDSRNEITTKDYYLRIYQGDHIIINEHYTGFEESNIVKNIISKKLENHQTYRAELVIIIREKEYVIDTTDFSIENEEITGIGSKDDFKWLQVDGNYIITGDIDLTDATGNTWYCSQIFNGHINFNGHSLTKGALTQAQIFYKIGENAVIENMVFNVDLSNTTSGYITYSRPLFYMNYGTIKNIKINLIGTKEAGNTEITLLGRDNYGTIEGFIVNLQKNLYCSKIAGTVCIYNRAGGIIRNGYVYGNNIQATYKINQDEYKDVGVITYDNLGTMENVFSLVNVMTTVQEENIYQDIGNIVAINEGTVKNSYSMEYGYKDVYKNGPGIAFDKLITENVYYFSKSYTFEASTETRLPYSALRNVTFQNEILNTNQGFNVDDYIEMGYYPQLILPRCMGTQEYLVLPTSTTEQEIDVLYTNVIENTDTTAIVDVSILNKAGENFASIEINDINTTTILSQKYENGISTVRIEIKDPRRCISQYSIAAIETEGLFGMSGTRKEYKDNNRVINISLYKPINSIDDWKKMNDSPTENYKLYTDFDFETYGDNICITTPLTGIIDGNNHTIKNVILPENTDKTLFKEIKILRNLNVDNYYLKTNRTSKLGVIANVSGNEGEITGCNFSNIYLNNNGGDQNQELYAGAIAVVQYTDRIPNPANTSTVLYFVKGISKIIDNTVNHITIVSNNTKKTMAGGLLGYANDNPGSWSYTKELYEILISNCYVQDCDIQVEGAQSTEGIGGLVGRVEYENKVNNQEITNCYATGKIKSNTKRLGGLVGYTYATVSQCYVDVDIETTNSTYIAGIVGEYYNTTENNLALGNLYSENEESSLSRCYGNKDDMSYAYDEQKINGVVSKEKLGAKGLLSNVQLSNESTYKDTIKMGTAYDYSKVTNGILPKLYNQEGTQLLPGQNDNEIRENKFTLESITTSGKTQNSFIVTGSIRSKLRDLEIIGIELENATATIEKVEASNTTYNFKAKVEVEKYLDTYKITKIYYKENGENKEESVSSQIELIFYKEIPSVVEWQKIDPNSGENYSITGDIDFTGITNPVVEIKVGRMVGLQKYTISNLNLTENTSLIKEVLFEIKNLKFDNIQITNNNSIGTGIILYNYGKSTNLDFTNITLQSKQNYVGPIAIQSGDVTNITSDNITINTEKTKVGQYRGAIAGIIYAPGMITNSTVTNSKIYGSTYLGGVAGLSENTGKSLRVDNITMDGSQRIGGIFGEGNGDDLHGTNNKIRGASYIGGLIGNGYAINSTYIGKYDKETTTGEAKDNADIYGTSNFVGGIAGYSLSDGKMINKNCTVENTWIRGASYVGGVAGIYYVDSVTVNNVRVEGTNYIGGAIGGAWARVDATVKNTDGTLKGTTVSNSEIIGTTGVGGITGYGYINYGGNEIAATVNNCTITGKTNVGGIVGYATSAIRRTKIVNSTIGTTNSQNVGTIVGIDRTYSVTDKPSADMSFIYNNYAKGCIVYGSSNVGGIVGSMQKTNKDAPLIRVYNNYNDSIIYGTTNVGGIVGNLAQALVYNNNNNATIISTGNNIGGIVGFLDNSSMDVDIKGDGSKLNKYISRVYNNYVARTTIQGASNVGGVIGGTAKALINGYISNGVQEYNYKNNYVDINLISANTTYVAMGIGSVANTAQEQDSALQNTYIYKYNKINGNLVSDLTDYYKDHSLVKAALEKSDTYTNANKLGWTSTSTVAYDYTVLTKGYYPIIKGLASAEQIGIVIPEDNDEIVTAAVATTLKMSRTGAIVYQKVNLPKITCYPVSASEINIEFDTINTSLYFTYTVEGQETSEKIYLKNRTYTFEYDYQTPVIIEISNGSASDTFMINPANIVERVSKVGDEYFYLTGNTLSSNKQVVEGEFVHIYKDKALSKEGYLYSLTTLQRISGETINQFALSEETKALGKYTYGNTTILNYAKYSIVNNEQGATERQTQIFVKNGMMEMLDSSQLNVVPNKIIIDAYNHNEYETVLGTNGVLYNLKTSIQFPENFSNERIESITNNLEENDSVIVVYYKTGRVYAFDYITGEVKFDNQVKVDISFWEYLNQQLNGATEADKTLESIQETYEQSTKLKEKLITMPVKETTITIPEENNTGSTEGTLSTPSNGTSSSQTMNSKSYVTSYDTTRQEYVVYKVDEVLNTDKQEIISENTKIEQQGLDSVYYESARQENGISNKGTVFIASCIILVLIFLVILNRRTTKKEKNKRKIKHYKNK